MDAKTRILNRAGELIPVIGVKNLTMDSIAVDLGISKRTIYELFLDKDDLIMQTLEHLIMRNNKRLLEIVEHSTHVIEALFVIIEEQHQQMLAYHPVFLEDMKKYFGKLNDRLYANCEKMKKFSVSYVLLEKGIREKIFLQELKIDIVDGFIQELVKLFHSNERIRLMKMDKKDALNNIMLPYFRGICTRKGLELMETYFDSNK